MFADPIEPQEPAFAEKLLSLNWLFILLVSALAGVGVASLYSVAGGSMEPWAESHVIRYCLGLAVLFGVALVDIRLWMRAAYPLYLIALGALILVPLIGVENGGARRWIALGGMSFQPAEFMKIALVLAMARYYQWLSPRHLSNPVALLAPVAMVLAPIALVALQPDLGTAILFAAIGVGILFLAGASWIYFVFGIVGVLAAVPFAWNAMHDYQQRRVLTFLNPGDGRSRAHHEDRQRSG